MRHAIALLLALLVSFAYAEEPAHTGGCEAQVTGTYTLALNNTAVGTASSSVNVGAVAVVYVKSSGTAGTQLAYQFSDDNTNWTNATAVPHGNWCLKKRARYLRFVGTGSTTGTVTAKYYSASAGAVVSLGSETVSVADAALGSQISSLMSNTNQIYVVPTKLEPTQFTAMTMTATTAWSYVYLTCTAQPCNITFWNQGPNTLFWWKDRSSSIPSFAGISMTAGSTPIKEDFAPGDAFHWRYDASGGNGFLINRYNN